MDEGEIASGEPSPRELLFLEMLGVVGRAPPHVLSFLAVADLVQIPLVSRTVRRNLQQIEYSRCRDGRLYQVPYPGYPGLLDSSKKDLQDGMENEKKNYEEGLFPHQLASLQMMHAFENVPAPFGTLKGGILGDMPGLGKTITMLALITSTAGKRPAVPNEFWDRRAILDGWIGLSQNPGRREDILKTLRPFRRLTIYQSLCKEVEPPFSLQDFPTVERFEKYVQETVKAHTTKAENERFRRNVTLLRAGLPKQLRKLLCSRQGKRIAWERLLFPSSATLLIVPDALLEHWFQQIHQHLNRKLFADEKEADSEATTNDEARGVIFLDGVGDIADARMPLGLVKTDTFELPQPWDLSKYLIVVTTFSRCEEEYKKEVQYGRMGNGDGQISGKRKSAETDSDAPSSSLLQTRWLRVVVDEGHELGTHESGNGVTRFVNHIAAERRWVLSGTPTTGDEDDLQYSAKALDQLQRLLLFLRHPVYGDIPEETGDIRPSIYVDTLDQSDGHNRRIKRKEKAKALFETKVKDPFLQKKREGREELLGLLRSVMVMHRKEDINLPNPIFTQADVDVPIPDDIQKNLQENPENSAQLLRGYLFSDAFQTLVDKAQGAYIASTIKKAKEALKRRGGALESSGFSGVRMLTAKEAEECRDGFADSDRRPVKAVVYSMNKNNLRDVTEALYTSLSMENIAEAYDDKGYDCSSELSRFRHNKREIRRCPICSFENDYGRADQSHRGREPKCNNILMEVVGRDNPNVRWLIETQRVKRALPITLGGNVTLQRMKGLRHEEYTATRKHWRVGDILEINIKDPSPVFVTRKSADQWQQYGAGDCIKLAAEEQYEGKSWFFGPLTLASDQFAGAVNNLLEVKLVKWQKCSRYHDPKKWYRGPRLSQVPLETIREDVFVLSLDAGLAHGLDLSFVTHIFLLEALDDASILEQITSRAHRLGATGPVIVDTVNPYYKLNPATEAIVSVAQENEKQETIARIKKTKIKSKSDKDTSLTRIVCQFCYRLFDDLASAEAHEAKQCPRNPQNVDVVDPWHLSSVYREIRPPPPQSSAQRLSETD